MGASEPGRGGKPSGGRLQRQLGFGYESAHRVYRTCSKRLTADVGWFGKARHDLPFAIAGRFEYGAAAANALTVRAELRPPSIS